MIAAVEADAVAFLAGLPHAHIALCSIDPEIGDPRGITRPAGSPDLGAFIRESHGVRNLYWGVNEPLPGAPDKRLGKADIARLWGVCADLDFDGGDAVAAAASRSKRETQLRELSLVPSITIETGGGYGLFWLFPEAIDATNQNVAEVEAQGRGLALSLDGDAVQNVDRIMRLPGTPNIPGPKKRGRGRVVAPAVLISANGQRYELGDLARLAPPQISPAKTEDPDAVPINIGLLYGATSFQELPLDLRIRALDLEAKHPFYEKFMAGRFDEVPMHTDKSGSGRLFAFASFLRANGFSVDDYTQLFAVWQRGLGSDWLEADQDKLLRNLRRAWTRCAEVLSTYAARPNVQDEFDLVTAADLEGIPKAGRGTGWPEPIDLFGSSLDLGLPDLPDNALPAEIEAFALDEGQRLGVEAGAIAFACVITAASCIDDRITLQPKQHDTSYVERACLWGALAGNPGDMKSPVIRAATKPLQGIEQAWTRNEVASRAAYVLAAKIHTEAERRYVKDPVGNPPAAPVAPPVRRAVVNDVTVESLSIILPDNPGGLLGVYDELSALFGSFDAYRDGKGRDRQDYLELYNGGERAIDRVSRGRISVPNWSLGLLGGIQPERLRKLASDLSEDGLVQRFLFVNCRRIGSGKDQSPNAKATAGYNDLLTCLSRLHPFTSDPIRLSPAAQRYREEVARLRETLCDLPGVGDALVGFAQKLEGFFARLLLTFHVIDTCFLSEPGEMVEQDTAARAHRFFARYVVPHSLHVHRTMLTGKGGNQHCVWVAGNLLAHPAPNVTAAQIGHHYKALRGQNAEIAKTMAVLEASGWCRKGEQTRTDSLRWDINPAIHDIFADRAAAETTRRAGEIAKIKAATAAMAELRGQI